MAKSVVGLYNDEILLSFDEKEHCYSIEGRKDHPPGVTSIIKETLGTSMGIAQWMANVAVDARDAGMPSKEAKLAHRTISKTATNIGKTVHAWAKRALLEPVLPPLPEDPQARKGCEAFRDWLRATDLGTIHSEMLCFSREHYYAGTLDLLSIGRKTSLLDLKTSSDVYREMPLQLGGYAICVEEMMGLKIDEGWIVILDKLTGRCKPYPVPITQKLKQTFIHLRDLHRDLPYLDKLTEEVKSNGLRQAAA